MRTLVGVVSLCAVVFILALAGVYWVTDQLELLIGTLNHD